jgi:hypothetical protein
MPKLKFNKTLTAGFCQCGCGQPTNIIKYDDPKSGRKAGQHKMYVVGHFHRHMRALGLVTGEQVDRAKRREIVRKDLIVSILESDGKKSLQEIASRVAPDFQLEGCSMMVNSARKWQLYGVDIPRIWTHHPKKIIPVYERPDIPNERETEIALLTFRRNFNSLDAPKFDDLDSHGFYASMSLNPLEILITKEEMESEEYRERERRMEEWQRWQERKTSSFSQEKLQYKK